MSIPYRLTQYLNANNPSGFATQADLKLFALQLKDIIDAINSGTIVDLSGYAKTDGSTPMATSQEQVFTSGVILASIQPLEDTVVIGSEAVSLTVDHSDDSINIWATKGRINGVESLTQDIDLSTTNIIGVKQGLVTAIS